MCAQEESDVRSRPVARATSGMAIAALVLGIIALLFAFVPFINVLVLILVAFGVLFALVGMIATLRGTRMGVGIAVSSLLLNLAAGAVVVFSPALYGIMFDTAVKFVTSEPVAEAIGDAVGSTLDVAFDSAADAMVAFASLGSSADALDAMSELAAGVAAAGVEGDEGAEGTADVEGTRAEPKSGPATGSAAPGSVARGSGA